MINLNFDIKELNTPCYIVDEALLKKNLEILKSVSDRTGCRILLAQKAFSMFYLYPLIKQYLSGTAASGLYEAKLGYEEMGGETHIFSPAYRKESFDEILRICDHIIFNSFSQWQKFKEKALKSGRSFGMRINPECSTQEHGIYDPCSAGSRLGVTIADFREDLLDGIDGLHFHTLCEQNSDALKTTLDAVEDKFGKYFNRMKWINFGGGHHITRSDYDIKTLIECIDWIQNKYNVHVYLEPGEAIALNTGFLVSEVVDIIQNSMNIAILDTSAACHMPDVLEMPYRPQIIGAGLPNEKPYTYRLGGSTCLAGDIISDYSFDKPLEVSDRLVFIDMAHYTMVKNNTFNGMPLPTIYSVSTDRKIIEVKKFDYIDFKTRLS
ncbi:MAG: carboxynorspermidine decarboxylase [Clostridiales bacterium GWF2_38_85]|nr:MAG: carboxynorspermidine decarboxylase [Clostridiales bacterium GWF2_38_85]HBL84856.1 carboxynorspermidine decarboxylase [Clostridiales bacterium]